MKAYKLRSLKELWETIQAVAAGIDKETLDALVQSMPDRCRAVIKSKSAPTKH